MAIQTSTDESQASLAQLATAWDTALALPLAQELYAAMQVSRPWPVSCCKASRLWPQPPAAPSPAYMADSQRCRPKELPARRLWQHRMH